MPTGRSVCPSPWRRNSLTGRWNLGRRIESQKPPSQAGFLPPPLCTPRASRPGVLFWLRAKGGCNSSGSNHFGTAHPTADRNLRPAGATGRAFPQHRPRADRHDGGHHHYGRHGIFPVVRHRNPDPAYAKRSLLHELTAELIECTGYPTPTRMRSWT